MNKTYLSDVYREQSQLIYLIYLPHSPTNKYTRYEKIKRHAPGVL